MQTAQQRQSLVIDEEEKNENRFSQTLAEVIAKPTASIEEPASQVKKMILQAFNQGVKTSVISHSWVRGIRIKPDEFLLVHRNGVAEVADYSEDRLALPLYAGFDTIEILGMPKQNAPFFGGFGKYVVNVPNGKFGLATKGNDQPVILDSGMHMVVDPTFKFDPNRGFVNKASPYLFHHSVHILQVPKGKLAKVWLGMTPILLESRPEPYVFNSPYFKIDKVNDELFVGTEMKYIAHGSLKRLMPRTGEVAVTYNNGKLEIIDSTNAPILIQSETHIVDGFLDTTVQTMEYPSLSAKKNREAEKASPNEINYIVCTTSDSRKIGIKLIVAYEFVDPLLTLTKLTSANVATHIEGLATSDMGKAISACNSQTFLNSKVNVPKPPHQIHNDLPSAPDLETFQNSLQDEVKNLLAGDLKVYGIKLIRLNIERYKILDEKISQQMEQQSLLTSEIGAKQSVLEQEFNIAKKHAEQKAEVLRIEQENQNANKLSAATTEREAAKLNAEALLIKSEADKKAALMQAEIFKQSPEMLTLALAKLQIEAFKGVKMSLTTQDFRNWTQNPLTFFNATSNSNNPKALLQLEEEKRSQSPTHS